MGSGLSSAVILDTVERYSQQQTECTFIEPYPDRLMSILKPQDKEKSRIITTKVRFNRVQVHARATRTLLRIRDVENGAPLILRGLRAPSRQGSWAILHAHTYTANLDLRTSGRLSADIRAQLQHLMTRRTFPYVPSTFPATNALVHPVSVANLSACGSVSRFNGLDNTAKL